MTVIVADEAWGTDENEKWGSDACTQEGKRRGCTVGGSYSSGWGHTWGKKRGKEQQKWSFVLVADSYLCDESEVPFHSFQQCGKHEKPQ